MKKLKYDMHEVICSIFNIIYPNHTLKNIEKSLLLLSQNLILLIINCNYASYHNLNIICS